MSYDLYLVYRYNCINYYKLAVGRVEKDRDSIFTTFNMETISFRYILEVVLGRETNHMI
jgi:hypothetical protein